MITFAIFFLVPRLAGQTAYQLAAQYVGRNPVPSEIKAVETKLGLNAPLYLQYGRYVKGIVVGIHYNNGTDVSYCPFPCFGYSFRNQQPVWPQLVSAAPVMAFLYAALYARLTRAGMLETMGEDFIRTARAKGLPERAVVIRHGLRATLTPIITIFGLDLGLLLGGAILTETTFSLPGLGQFTILAIQNQDLPEIMGVVMLASFFIIIANMVVDMVYAVADPRVRI